MFSVALCSLELGIQTTYRAVIKMSDSDSLTEEWTEDMCIKLIREFKARPILWDPKNPLYFKAALKPAAWEDIANSMNIRPGVCKHKMVVLMSSFRREKAKLINSIKKQNTGKTTTKYTSTWFAFKEMMFMLDKDSEKNRQLRVTGTENNEESQSIKTALLRQYIQPPIRTKRKTVKAYYNRALKTPKKSVREKTTSEADPSTSQALSDRDEEIKFFTSFIGNKMKKYRDTTKNAVQQAICDIIFQADQNYYEIGPKISSVINEDPLANIVTNEDSEPVVQIKEQPLSDSD